MEKHYLKPKKDQTHPIPSMGLVYLPTFYDKNQPFMSVNIPFVPRILWESLETLPAGVAHLGRSAGTGPGSRVGGGENM